MQRNRYGNGQAPQEIRVVLSLISERDADNIQEVIFWPLRWAGIIVASLLFGLVIPCVAFLAYALLF